MSAGFYFDRAASSRGSLLKSRKQISLLFSSHLTLPLTQTSLLRARVRSSFRSVRCSLFSRSATCKLTYIEATTASQHSLKSSASFRKGPTGHARRKLSRNLQQHFTTAPVSPTKPRALHRKPHTFFATYTTRVGDKCPTSPMKKSLWPRLLFPTTVFFS